MLDYTIVATKKTVEDIKRFSLVFSILTQILYIGYLIYALVCDLGFIWLNIPLLAISSAYLVFYLIVNGKSGKKIKEARKNARHTYKFVKISAASFNLAVLLYSIWAFPEEVKPISIVFATLMTVVLVLHLATELVCVFAERRMNLFIEALKADLEVVTKPLDSAKNFVRKIRGEEPLVNEDEPTSQRKMLDERVSKRRAEKRERKHEKKEKLIDFVFGRNRISEKSEAEDNEFAERK